MTRALTFENMIPAITTYSAAKDWLYRELDQMVATGNLTDTNFAEWEKRLTENEDMIREAYYLDTCDRNSRNNVAGTNADTLVSLAKQIMASKK